MSVDVTTAQALLVFLATPLAIVGLITGLVFAIARRDVRRPPEGLPVGITAVSSHCDVHTEADGRVIHEPANGDSGGRTCWTLACAECGTRYQEGPHEAHFTGPRQAITIAGARGWALAGHRMRCPRCA
jgi:hypothetical protein